MTAMIEIVAARFAFRLIAPLLFQSWIMGPNVLCDINQLCKRLDDFAKQKEASKNQRNCWDKRQDNASNTNGKCD